MIEKELNKDVSELEIKPYKVLIRSLLIGVSVTMSLYIVANEGKYRRCEVENERNIITIAKRDSLIEAQRLRSLAKDRMIDSLIRNDFRRVSIEKEEKRNTTILLDSVKNILKEIKLRR